MTSVSTYIYMPLLATIIATLLVFPVDAGEIKCATWNMQWFPSGVANRRLPDIETARIREAGETIIKVSPSILFVQEIRDKDACEKLAVASGTNGLKVAVCSGFKDNAGIPVFQQCAIMTIYPVVESSYERWHSYGIVDPPRGYAYALLDVGGELVACYCVHLKSNLIKKENDRQMNILKRELATSQLMERIGKTCSHDGRKVTTFIIAGDFNTNLDELAYLSEGTIRALIDSGFKDGFEGLNRKDRVTLPAKNQFQDVTFDYIFHKGFADQKFIGVMPSSEISDHRLVALMLYP